MPQPIPSARDVMLTPEETRVLHYLQHHGMATTESILRSCLVGASAPLVERVLSNLEWFGWVIVYSDAGGKPAMVQITEQGLAHAARGATRHKPAG